MKNDKITKQVQDVCKIGQGADCCRYLVMGPKGFECTKHDAKVKEELDRKVEMGMFTSKGDNCDGFSEEESIKILNK